MTDLATPTTTELLDIPLVRIHPAADNPRRSFDEAALEELAESIRAQGILQPAVVTPDPEADGDYELVLGERRWRAGKLAGLDTLPCVVRHFPDPVARAMAMLTENLKRADLDPIDEAAAFAHLTKDLKVTQRTLAEQLGCSQSHIAKRLQLDKLPDEAKDALTAGRLTIGQALDLAGLKDRDRVKKLVAGDAKINPYEIEHAVGQQKRAEERAAAEKELETSGLKTAPSDANWSGDWKKLKTPDGATHGLIVGGKVDWYRKKTKAEKEPKPAKNTGSADASKIDPSKAERDAEWAKLRERQELWKAIDAEHREHVVAHLAGNFDAARAAWFTQDVLVDLVITEGRYVEPNPKTICGLLGIPVENDAWDGGADELRSYLDSSGSGARQLISTALMADLCLGYWSDTADTADGQGLDVLAAAFQQWLTATGYEPSDIEAAELARINGTETAPQAEPATDDTSPVVEAEAETTGEDSAPSPVLDAPDDPPTVDPVDEAGDDDRSNTDPSPAEPEPAAAEDRATRLNLAKAEGKALKAWTADGEQGTRPATPNLDAINAVRA